MRQGHLEGMRQTRRTGTGRGSNESAVHLHWRRTGWLEEERILLTSSRKVNLSDGSEQVAPGA